MSVNKVILLGNLGKDPELKYSEAGIAACTFSVATTERWKVDGVQKDKTTWHNVVFFGKQAETVSNYFKRGNRIFIEGKIDNYSFDKKDGSGKGYGSKVIGQAFTFVDGKNTKEEAEHLTEAAEQPTQDDKEDDSDLPF